MTDGIIIPAYREAACTAGQVSAILARPRPTITGWINRYDWLGIAKVAQGSTRLFSCADIGILVALRLAIDAGNMTEALFRGLQLIEPEIEAEFDVLFQQVHLEKSPGSGALCPQLPPLPLNHKELRLINLGGIGEPAAHGSIMRARFRPAHSDEGSGAYIADLAGYRLPQTTLHLGQGLRKAWNRMLRGLNGFSVDG